MVAVGGNGAGAAAAGGGAAGAAAGGVAGGAAGSEVCAIAAALISNAVPTATIDTRFVTSQRRMAIPLVIGPSFEAKDGPNQPQFG